MKSILYKDTAETSTFQLEKLRELIDYVSVNSIFYKKLLSQHSASSSVRSLSDLSKIPFTTKEDIEKQNEDFFCVERKRIIDYVTTSGTLGKPITIALTDNDLKRLAQNEKTSFEITGGTENDVYQLMTTIDRRFMAGLAYFLGARELGAGIIRVGNGIPELQWDTINRIKPTAIICVPSFILKLISYARENNIDFKNSSITKAICIGEPIRSEDFSFNTLGRKIKELWDIELFSTYASSEMGAAFTECEAGKGGHLQPDLLIAELIDEEGNPAKENEPGELVITTLGIEGTPLLRFKTGDICKMHYEKCSCGRTSPRISPIIGRKKQMIKFKGTTLFPNAFFEVLDSVKEVQNYQIEVFTNEIGTDELLARVFCQSPSEKLEKDIKDHFRAKLRVAPSVIFETEEKLREVVFPEISRKPVRFVDKRKN
ncbi:MAG: phenylacetate--CoA ligase family protein [Bacteroidia bacterium]